MTRPLSSSNSAELALSVTRPCYLIELGLATTLRLSSRETVTFRGNSFTAATVRVDLSGNRIQLYNDSLSFTSTFLAGVSGKTATVWLAYGETPFADADGDVVFEGEIGAVGVGETIDIRLRPAPVRRIPRLYVTPTTFNHLPPDGLQILTPSGVFTLERKA
jgi:hypothetical protein